MKIAVYTIAKNEEQFVERWYNSAKNADYLLIVDTGSSDNTITAAKNLGINVVSINVNPFRFDDARNVSLSLWSRFTRWTSIGLHRFRYSFSIQTFEWI